MSKERIIDQIWQKMSQLSLTLENDVTHLRITKEGLNDLLEDYREEFYQPEASFDDLQSYLGLEILTSVSKSWRSEEQFKLLKSVEYM